MTTTTNPLLDFSGLPRFDAIRPEHVTPAVDALLARRAPRDRDDRDGPARRRRGTRVVEPLAESLDRLDRAWGAVRHLNAVVNTPELRDAHNANLPKIVAFHTDLGQDLRVYDKYRALRAQPAFATLDAARKQLVDNELRDFKLSGAELDDAGKARFKAVQEALADLSTQFEEHLLDATNAWAHYVDDAAALAGVPDDVLAEARAAAQADGRAGYKLTLRMPSLPAGHAVRARPRPAPARARGVLDARVRPLRAPGVGQRAAGRAHPRAAPRGRAAAGLRQLRAGVARAEDGAEARTR